MRARLVWNRSAVGYRSVSAHKPKSSALTPREPRQAMRGRQGRQPMRAQAGLESIGCWVPLGIGTEAKEQCPCAPGAPAGNAWSAGLESLGLWVPLGISTEAKEQCPCTPGAPAGNAWSAGPTANACASWSSIATPLGIARYRSCGAVAWQMPLQTSGYTGLTLSEGSLRSQSVLRQTT